MYKKPHIIFSVENPYHEKKVNISHEDVFNNLKNAGFPIHEVSGKYGNEERSLFLENPNKKQIKDIFKLAEMLGQDSVLISDGKQHEIHYVNGPNKGMHHKGMGTTEYSDKPSDFYTSLGDKYFTHNINFEEMHPEHKSDLLKNYKEKEMKKSEKEDIHPFESGENINLVHLSPKKLDIIDPSFDGTRTRTTNWKKGKGSELEHPLSWFYMEGIEPESIVKQGSNFKHIVPLKGLRLYDMSKDKDNIYGKLKEESKNRQINPGVVTREDFFKAIKDAGYHGVYNSEMGDHTMRHVAGLFYKTKPHKIEKIGD